LPEKQGFLLELVMLDNPQPISVLIVEDDETLQETIGYNLEREGYTVVAALDGPTAT
jgi:CheY-like chemotaxis protein